jgi:sugar-phosphatase
VQCRGFLFDLDGTLVDSLPVVERSWCHWADRHGIDHQDVLNFIHGKQAITSLRHFLAGRSEEDIQAERNILKPPIRTASPRYRARANCLSI